MAYKEKRGKIIYEGYEDHRGRTGYALVFLLNTSGFATTHVVVSVRHPITY